MSRMYRRRAIALLAVLALPLVACQDLAAPKAGFPTVADTLRASALSGTPLGARSALDAYTPSVKVPDGNMFYDIVFDIDDAGKPVLIPVSKFALCTRLCQVGLQVVTDSTFDQLRKARSKGYTYDSATTISVGTPVLIVAKSVGCSQDIYSNDLYAKLVVDSVRTADRSVFFRIVTDQSCGFRELIPGEVPNS
jgi:hypothetical protein